MNDRLLEAKELAQRLNVPATWVLEQARSEAIPHLRLGRYVRFDWKTVEAWLAELERGNGRAYRKHQPKESA